LDPGQSSTSHRGGWLWVVMGMLAGALLLGTLVPIVMEVPPRPQVAIVVGALSLLLMGVLVGFRSPGRTLIEPAVAGLLLALLALAYASIPAALPAAYWIAAAIAGPALGAGGGVVGEVLQASVQLGARPGLRWSWILVGAILGVVLNVYAVFIPRGLFGWYDLRLLGTFAGSFFVVGLFVGYMSPGLTILEPALAAVFTIALDLVLVVVGFSAPFPIVVAVLAAMVAFAIALSGGYVGEVAQARRTRSSMGGKPGEFSRVPTPGEAKAKAGLS
jgi:hypothetical protein